MFTIGETVQFILDGQLRIGTVQDMQTGILWVQVMGFRQKVGIPAQYVMSAIDADEYDDAFPQRDYDSDAEYAEYMARFTH
jgi:hypothetical protein